MTQSQLLALVDAGNRHSLKRIAEVLENLSGPVADDDHYLADAARDQRLEDVSEQRLPAHLD